PETKRLLAWNDTRPPLIVQPARWSLGRLEEELRAGGIETTRAPFDAGLEVRATRPPSRVPHPANLPGYTEGGFVVQDPAHALVARFAAIPPRAQVYDACAAPGRTAVALEVAGGQG